MARFDTIDLSKLPTPSVVEEVDFESYLESFKVDFKARAEEIGFAYNVETLESDPVVKVFARCCCDSVITMLPAP